MLRLRNVGVFDERLRHNMTAGKVTGTYKKKLHSGAAFLCLFFVILPGQIRHKKKPAQGGQNNRVLQGFSTQGHHTTS
jgi:hypothetical protein